jgi:phosphoenolpyruvate---glycerone phosphotransferase subunit DhaL
VLPDLLKAIGTKLVMTIGGTFGPLYRTLFLALGEALPAEHSPTQAAAAFVAAIEAVNANGTSDIGQKTMLDVFAPARDALTLGSGAAVTAKAADATEHRSKPSTCSPRSWAKVRSAILTPTPVRPNR